MNGPQTFIRYAYPPNHLGYCGPGDAGALIEYGQAGQTDQGLHQLINAFDGAYPYLELIAHSAGIADPLDRRVVEAYWLGNGLLSAVTMPTLGTSMDDRFRSRTGRNWDHVAEAVWAGGLPHHSFHVFAVYPWAGLLRGGRIEEPLKVLDGCTIRWGRVLRAEDSGPIVEIAPLEWSGGGLAFGSDHEEQVVASPFQPVEPGDWVSVHWNRVCGRLTDDQVRHLRAITGFHLRLVNQELSLPLATIAG
ncbi:MAG: DUF6390 family protein [Acidimicrobiia bacterium]|nr:DUF6390 family protein [Acidimicrobiia bacterium]